MEHAITTQITPEARLHDVGELTVINEDHGRCHHRVAMVLIFDSLEEALDSADALVMPSDGVWNHPLLALVRPDVVLSRLISGDRRPLHLQFAEMPHSILLEDAGILRNINHPEDLE